MTPREWFDGGSTYIKRRFSDAPVFTTVQIVAYIMMAIAMATMSWTLRTSGHILLSFKTMERDIFDLKADVGKLKEENLPEKFRNVEKRVKELEDIHPRQR